MTINQSLPARRHGAVREFCRQVFSYGVVGACATALDWGTFYLAYQQWHWPWRLALGSAFFLGITTNYVLNKIITFRNQGASIPRQLLRYTIVVSITLLLSYLLMHLLMDWLAIFTNALFSRITVTFILYLPNFLMQKYITFNQRASD